MKLCRDCQHYRPTDQGGPGHQHAHALCAHPAVLSPVSGEAHVTCLSLRNSLALFHCGPKGEAFEPRATPAPPPRTEPQPPAPETNPPAAYTPTVQEFRALAAEAGLLFTGGIRELELILDRTPVITKAEVQVWLQKVLESASFIRPDQASQIAHSKFHLQFKVSELPGELPGDPPQAIFELLHPFTRAGLRLFIIRNS